MWFKKIWTEQHIIHTKIPNGIASFRICSNEKSTRVFRSKIFTTHHSMFPVHSPPLNLWIFLAIARQFGFVCLNFFSPFCFLLKEFSFVDIGYLTLLPWASWFCWINSHFFWVSIFLVLQCQLFVWQEKVLFLVGITGTHKMMSHSW